MSTVVGYIPKDLEDALEHGMVPTAPLVRILKPLIGPYEGSKYRAISRFECGQEYTNFDYADSLLCYVGHPELWREDEELGGLYYRVNLAERPLVEVGSSAGPDVCRNGHLRTPENTGLQNKKDGRRSRRCLECNREADKKYRQKHGERLNRERRMKRRGAETGTSRTRPTRSGSRGKAA